jgi:hypothetical protein
LAETERTEVLVLATPHTAGIPHLGPGHFSGLLAVLDEWGPDAIALERLSAKEIFALGEDPEMKPVIEQFVGAAGRLAAEAQGELGLSAARASRRMLNWDDPSSGLDPATRTERVLTALAAYEVETALLYWNASDDLEGLSSSITTFLHRAAASTNERVALGVTLAAREGHPRLWSVDSHQDKDLLMPLVEDLTAGLEAAGDAASVRTMSPYDVEPEVTKRAIEAGDLWPLYAFLNSRQYAVDDVRGQFDLFNRIDFPNDAGRSREAAWDERNYRIAANIRRVTARHPGGRVLVIIGAGHKPFLDELLLTSLDVRVVQLAELKRSN